MIIRTTNKKYENKFNNYWFYSFLIIVIFSCSERERENPLDSKSKRKPAVNLHIESHNNRIDLEWTESNIIDIIGYNLYRREHTDSAYKMIYLALPKEISYTDYNIIFGNTYSYYITILGEGTESFPTNSVSISPGPGYNWIVDKYGYQVIKTTYDARYKLLHYYTDWPPADIAIDSQNNHALITQPAGKELVIINTNSAGLLTTYGNNDRIYINNPYMVEYEPQFGFFWVCDSSGSLYRISSSDYHIELIDSSLGKPIDITFEPKNEIINVLDSYNKNIWRYSYNGTFLGNIDYIGNHQLINPKFFLINSVDNQFWLIDRINNKDYIYRGNIQTQLILPVDSLDYAKELSINPFDQSAWVISQKGTNSTILQLSKDGIRQLELSGFNNPYHLVHNPYDGTLLVADSRNYRFVHYTLGFKILGIYSHLNFPVRVKVE